MAAMAKVGVEFDPETKVAELSIAGRQLVAICRALAADARLIIMDEPTASLTRHEVDALIALVSDLKRGGICIVFVSHRLDEVLEIAERVTVLRDGAKVGTFAAATIDDRKLSHLMTGKRFRLRASTPAMSRPAPVVLELQGPRPRWRLRGCRACDCAPARSSASPACSARAAPSSRCRCSA